MQRWLAWDRLLSRRQETKEYGVEAQAGERGHAVVEVPDDVIFDD